MFFSPNKTIIGLELDYCELRAVELLHTKRGLHLLNWGRAPLPREALSEGLILQPQAVGEALERLWSEKGFKSRNVVTGVSNKEVLVRFSEFPVVPRDKLGPMIRYHTRDLLPISMDDAIMDFSVIGPVATDEQEDTKEKEKLQEILLVATQRSMINNYLEALKRACLKPLDINVIPLVLQNLMPPDSAAGATIILDLANGSSNILVTAADKPRLARRLTLRLQDVATNLFCSLDEVIDRSGAPPGEIFPDAFIDWGETLVGEIRSSINYYQSQPGALPVEQLILSGRGAAILGFAGQLQEIFTVPVLLANPLQFLEKMPPDNTFSETDRLDYSLSFALARGRMEAS